MTASSEIDALLDQSSTCPSALVLDRLHLGHVSPEEADETRQHVASCDRCQRRMEHRRRQTMGLSEVGARRILGSLKQACREEPPDARTTETLRQAVGTEARTRLVPLDEKGEGEGTDAAKGTDEVSAARRRRRRTVVATVVTLAAAAAVAFVVIGVERAKKGPPAGDDRDTVRVMGSVKLTVFRKRGQKVSEAVSGDAFRAGDKVRFQVTAPGAGYILILGVESNGESYMAHPSTGPRKSRPVSEPDAVLPGAMELDDSPRTEWLHLVYCPRPFSRDQIKSSKQHPDRVTIPKGCSKDTFELRKARQP